MTVTLAKYEFPNTLDDGFTVTGIPASEIGKRLAEPFGPEAYKPVPGGATLTDINTGYMIERVTEVFGPKGVGWNLKFSPDDMVIEREGNNKRVTAYLKHAVFQYVLVDKSGNGYTFEIDTSGVNTNQYEYAPEGARTSALGAALKGLCFQSAIYKNMTRADGSPKPRGEQKQKPEPQADHAQSASDPVRAYLTSKKQYVIDELGETNDDAKALITQLMKENNLTGEGAFTVREKFDKIVEDCVRDLKGASGQEKSKDS